MMAVAEFDLIERIRARSTVRDDVLLGIGDDAALLRVPAGRDLAVSADTLNVGVHFAESASAADVGWKSLAVNLSDLAAMAAQPAWCTLALSMPSADERWLEDFIDGFLTLAKMHDIALVGGDTTCGPLSISVTVIGWVEPGKALRRDRARIGDDVWATGTLGDAAAALRLLNGGDEVPEALAQRLQRPSPRIGAGRKLLSLAHACIDLSDGLLADLGHICERSGVGAEIDLPALPASAALCAAFDEPGRWELQAGGGDDYELCFTAAAAVRDEIIHALREIDVPGARIGRITSGSGVTALDWKGNAWPMSRRGYQHFS